MAKYSSRWPARALLLCVLALLGGCAAQRVRDCAALAGAQWSALSAAPSNAADLLGGQGLPNDPQTVWFARGGDRLLACVDAPGLTNPACGGAMAYEFDKAQGRWTPAGTMLSPCE